MKNGSLTFIKIIIGLLATIAIVVVGYQLYKYAFVTIKTENAIMGELDETVDAVGVFFRNEAIIDDGGYDYLDVVRAEGERVAAGGILARVYRDEASAMTQKEIRRIQEKIDTYEEVISYSGSYQSSIDSINKAIYDNLSNLAAIAQEGKSVDTFNVVDTIYIDVMKKKIASGDLVHYDSVLAELRSELQDLKRSAGDSVKAIYGQKSGYFSLGTDELEDELNLEYLAELNAGNFDQAKELCKKNAENKSGAHLGKMVYDNCWYVAVKVPSDSVMRLELKDTVYINIPSFGADKIKCTIDDIRKEGEETVLVLSSSVIDDNILTLRMEDVRLIIKTHNGIQVRQSALRKVDGKDGVFVKVGLLLRYKEVEVIYNDGSTALVKYDAAQNDGLRLYDQVVYKGSGLYDGKAVS